MYHTSDVNMPAICTQYALSRHVTSSVATMMEIAIFQKNMEDRNGNIIPVGTIFSTIFNAFYELRLNYVFSVHAFSVHAICTADNYFMIVTHTLHLSEKNILSCALVIKYCYYYRHFCLQKHLALPELWCCAVIKSF